MHKHVVPFCVPVSLVHLMNIDHAHPDTLLDAARRKSVVSERQGETFFFSPKCASVESFLPKIDALINMTKMYLKIHYKRENMFMKNLLWFC